MASTGQLQDRLQTTSAEFQKIQSDISNVLEIRQRLDAQQSENELVKKEFSALTPNNTIYKLVGPVLVPQDQSEAKSNVDKRLDFIRADIKRVDGQLKDLEEKLEKKRQELVDLQTSLQSKQQEVASAPAGPITA